MAIKFDGSKILPHELTMVRINIGTYLEQIEEGFPLNDVDRFELSELRKRAAKLEQYEINRLKKQHADSP